MQAVLGVELVAAGRSYGVRVTLEPTQKFSNLFSEDERACETTPRNCPTENADAVVGIVKNTKKASIMIIASTSLFFRTDIKTAVKD